MNEEEVLVHEPEAKSQKEFEVDYYIEKIIDGMGDYFSNKSEGAKWGDPSLKDLLSKIPRKGWLEQQNPDEVNVVGFYSQEEIMPDGKRDIQFLTLMSDYDIHFERWLPDEDKEDLHPDSPLHFIRNLTTRDDTIRIETADSDIYTFLPKHKTGVRFAISEAKKTFKEVMTLLRNRS
jgi:hypothetical protein